MKPLLIACDFDGTITQRDTLHVIVERYGVRDLWDTFEGRLRSGEITVEQAMQEEFAAVRATSGEVREAVREHAPLRDGFVEFVDWAENAGHRVLVCSNGFRSVIEPVLAEAALDHLEVVSHDARFSLAGAELVWSDRGERCALCGRACKRHPVRERWRGETLVYLGDGISDRCVARMADVVFARDGLADYLAAEGVEFVPFADFHEVREVLCPVPGP